MPLHGHRGQCAQNHIVSDRRVFCIGGKTCEHADARAALHDASARGGMFASRFPSSQLSKNASFPTVEKRLVLHYTSASLRENAASFALTNSSINDG